MDWTSKKKAVLRMVKAKGFALQIIKVTSGTKNATTGVIAETETEYDGYGLFQSLSFEAPRNSIILEGDKEVLVPALDLGCVPAPGDILAYDDGVTRLKIVAVDSLSPGNDPIMYTVLARA